MTMTMMMMMVMMGEAGCGSWVRRAAAVMARDEGDGGAVRTAANAARASQLDAVERQITQRRRRVATQL